MSTFEFVLVLTAIIVGFGVAEILKGWGDQFRSGRPFSALQVLAAAYVLMMSFRMLWMQWGVQREAWSYLDYLVTTSAPVIFALAARVLRFDPTDERTAEAQYFAGHRAVYGLLALNPILGLVRFVVLASAAYSDGVGLWVPLVTWPLVLVTCAGLAWSANPRHHWIGLSVLWAIHLGWSFLVQPDLAPG